MKNFSPKVAIFYDWLNQWGGAERVLLDLLSIFPNSPVYTLVHDPQKTSWLPKNTNIITSFIQKLPHSTNNPFYYAPLYPLALEQFGFSSYDIIISSTTTVGHCLLTPPHTLSVCYFHNLNRRIYPSSFPLSLYQKIDKIYSRRPDLVLTSSKNVQSKIKKYYDLNSQLIYPGVDTKKFNLKKVTDSHLPFTDYFLVVSRLVPHKRIDLAIEACLRLNQNLVIVGTGRQENQLHNRYSQYHQIKFLGAIPEKQLITFYQNCHALICPQQEDFGLTPLEAMACDRPVIALKSGGYLETIINGKTGILFDQQSVDSLSSALNSFSQIIFDPLVCRHQAEKFSLNRFMLNFKKTIFDSWTATHT